jgi:hypothetical protein
MLTRNTPNPYAKGIVQILLFFLPVFASSTGLSASTGADLVGGFGAATVVGWSLGAWVCDWIGVFNILLITCMPSSVSMLAI